MDYCFTSCLKNKSELQERDVDYVGKTSFLKNAETVTSYRRKMELSETRYDQPLFKVISTLWRPTIVLGT